MVLILHLTNTRCPSLQHPFIRIYHKTGPLKTNNSLNSEVLHTKSTTNYVCCILRGKKLDHVLTNEKIFQTFTSCLGKSNTNEYRVLLTTSSTYS
jgi:hypothetical protein